MGRRQMGKGYARRQLDKHTDRDKIAFQKAERKGIRGLMNDNQQLREEIALLDKQHERDQHVIRHQNEVITKLEKQVKRAYWEGALYVGTLLSAMYTVIILLFLWG